MTSYNTSDLCPFCGEPLGDHRRQEVVFICSSDRCPEGEHDWTSLATFEDPHIANLCLKCGEHRLTPPTR